MSTTNEKNLTGLKIKDTLYKIPSKIEDLEDGYKILPHVFVANKDNFYDILKNAPEGSVIELDIKEEDNFTIDLIKYPDCKSTDGSKAGVELGDVFTFSDNITFKGGVIKGVNLNSGINQAYYYYVGQPYRTKDQIEYSILPKGLVFDNITFTDNFKVLNCMIEDLKIINCKFQKNTCLEIDPNKISSTATRYMIPHRQSDETWDNNINAKGYAKNIIINNNIFDSFTLTSGTDTRILCIAVENINIENNIFLSSDWNVIQLGGKNVRPDYDGGTHSFNFDVCNIGNIFIKNNFAKNIGSRAMRLKLFENANIQIFNNSYETKDQKPGESRENGKEVIKITDYKNSKIEAIGNTYMGNHTTTSENNGTFLELTGTNGIIYSEGNQGENISYSYRYDTNTRVLEYWIYAKNFSNYIHFDFSNDYVFYSPDGEQPLTYVMAQTWTEDSGPHPLIVEEWLYTNKGTVSNRYNDLEIYFQNNIDNMTSRKASIYIKGINI